MNRKFLQGRAPTLRDQQRAVASLNSHYCGVDFDVLRPALSARLFVGPPCPLSLRPEFQPDVKAERAQARYWQLAADLKRYGYCEINQHGTPFVGDAFGFGHQSNEVYP